MLGGGGCAAGGNLGEGTDNAGAEVCARCIGESTSPSREDTTLGVVGKPVGSAEGASVMMGVRTPGVGRKADLGWGWLNVDDPEGGKTGLCLLVDWNGVPCCFERDG